MIAYTNLSLPSYILGPKHIIQTLSLDHFIKFLCVSKPPKPNLKARMILKLAI